MDIRIKQREFFESGVTRSVSYRKETLNDLYKAIQKEEPALIKALSLDLGKSEFEAFSNEIGLLYTEIKYTIKHLSRWAKRSIKNPTLAVLPGRSWTKAEPKGSILIFAPWNYPVNLLFMPLIAAIAAGNTAVLKPSEYAPHTSKVCERIIKNTFKPEYIAIINGGPEIANKLIDLAFDHIFFTGSTAVGKVVMKAASEHLTPVTLELGGKSPVIVDKTAKLKYAAQKILWGKFNNAGQTCIAPDYVLVEDSIKEEFLHILPQVVRDFYGEDPRKSPEYGRIISERHHERLIRLMESSTVLTGGKYNRSDKYLEPTLLYPVEWDTPIMEEEIFGPLLPILSFSDLDDAIRQVRFRPTPLALYMFSESKQNQRKVVESLSFGGGGINTTILHVASHYLPFGGVGQSGMGSYHGKAGFDNLSHYKSLLYQPSWLDIPMAYPHKKISLGLLRKFFK
ncbi:aldehyde dehydrogenase [Spirochaeta cellobiosiphila]|uniref:aldehyde dehydrogenase n=1 Tax=Spirochaeta cellobiosiphila TaxID=504483 RepID=UPI00040A0F5F|nr:aldehyde dehydrogenase [Spirochaeta cellobiosiphila]